MGEWIITNAKPCPSCKAPIEKNEGCMHMTCIVWCAICQLSSVALVLMYSFFPLSYHEFCWLCRAPWNTHGEQTGGYYACNRYETSPVRLLAAVHARSYRR